MAQQYAEIPDKLKAFIEAQKMFFVGTAAAEGRVNVSPKGMDSLRVINPNRVVWLNVTGSGNESAAHVLDNPRMTLMFCAFEGPPMILRLYGEALAVHHKDAAWDELYGLFTPGVGARQLFDMRVDLVQTSCGFGVPLYEYAEQRSQLNAWAERKGADGIRDYWLENNQFSLDGLPTLIKEKNT